MLQTFYYKTLQKDPNKGLNRLKLVIMDNVNGSALGKVSAFTNDLYSQFRQHFFTMFKTNNSYVDCPPQGRRNCTHVILCKMGGEDFDLCINAYRPSDIDKKTLTDVVTSYIDNTKRPWTAAYIDLTPRGPSGLARVQKIKPGKIYKAPER